MINRSAMLLTVLLTACGGDAPSEPEQPPVSYVAREPGSNVQATNPSSFELLFASGPVRFESLRQLIIAKGKQCDAVTGAHLLGGLAGSDEWRVTCQNTGEWTVWLRSEAPNEVLRCSTKCE